MLRVRLMTSVSRYIESVSSQNGSAIGDGASCPHTSQCMSLFLAKSSILFSSGCIRCMVSLNMVGFSECFLERGMEWNCLAFLIPLGLGMAFLVPTMHISVDDMV